MDKTATDKFGGLSRDNPSTDGDTLNMCLALGAKKKKKGFFMSFSGLFHVTCVKAMKKAAILGLSDWLVP